jgi:hypothetical protein
MTLFCTHGRPVGASAEEKERANKQGMASSLFSSTVWPAAEREGTIAIADAFVDFWSHSSRSHLVDEDLCKVGFAEAADLLLDGGPKTEYFARSLVDSSISYKQMAKKGVDVFASEWKRQGPSSESIETIHNIQTRAGLVKYLAKTIPCSCLDEQKKAAKAGPKIGVCYFCLQKETNVKLFMCGRCRMVKYCSTGVVCLEYMLSLRFISIVRVLLRLSHCH